MARPASTAAAPVTASGRSLPGCRLPPLPVFGAPGAAAGAEADATPAALAAACTVTWVVVVAAVQATATVTAVCSRSRAANLRGAKIRAMPAVSGIHGPVSRNIPFPVSASPVIGTLPASAPSRLPRPATPDTDIGEALTGNAEPSALAGAESITMSCLPTVAGPVAVSLMGTRLTVVVDVPTVTVHV